MASTETDTAAGPEPHDHSQCVRHALAQAEQVCHARGLRLTALRRQVLELVWASHKPVGAYAILDQLAATGRRPAPPTVYRSLDFLLESGLIHRIESRNAFVGCDHPGKTHTAQFLICRTCGNVLEQDPEPVMRTLRKGARQVGFRVDSGTIEMSGHCAACLRGETAC